MEINLQNLDALFTGFGMAFERGLARKPSYYEKIATVVPSSASRTLYPWLGETTKFREWVGERVIQGLEAHGYTIVNRDYENTIGVNRNAIEDDEYGVYSPMFERLGEDVKVHPDSLVFGLITNAIQSPQSVICYDGQPFFSASHPVGLAGAAPALVSNIDSSGSGPYWYLLDVSSALKPFIFQKRQDYTFTRMNALTDEMVFMQKIFRFGVDARVNVGVGLWQYAYASNADLSAPANYAAARAAMRSIKTDAGMPFGSLGADGIDNALLLTPPALEESARQLLHSDFMIGSGASASVPATNIWKNSAGLIVSPYLS